MDENPYQAPDSDVSQDPILSESRYNHIANGQKIVIDATLAYFAVVSVLIGLGSHVIMKVVYVVMLFLPILNILALANVSGRATKALRDAGFKVGLFGVKKST